MHDKLLSNKIVERRKQLSLYTVFPFSSGMGRRNTIALLLFYIVISSYACQDKKQDKKMDTQESTPQQHSDTGRLLSVANLEQTDSGRKVIAWFFETPQVFELSMDSAGAQNMLSQLKEAKEKQWPVNVHSATDKDKNRIISVTPATEVQRTNYQRIKAGREQPTPVPPPKNQ